MNQDEQLYSDVGEMKKFLIGSEFDKKNCLSYRFDSMEEKVCLMQNQLHTLLDEREKKANKIQWSSIFKFIKIFKATV